MWRLDSAGRLVASMSNPFQIANSTYPVCSHFEGCLGVMTPPTVSAGVQPLAWQPIPLSTPLRPTPGGWMHDQLVAQRSGFGGHEYPMAGGGANDVHTVWRDQWLGGGFATGMGGKLAEGKKTCKSLAVTTFHKMFHHACPTRWPASSSMTRSFGLSLWVFSGYPYWLNGFVPLVCLLVRVPATWTILQRDGRKHLGLWYNVLPEHQIALITSGCVSE